MICWGQFENNLNTETVRTVKPAFIQVKRDLYEYEVDRFYVVPVDRSASGNHSNYIRNLNDDFKVKKGDKLSVSVDWRFGFRETDVPGGLSGNPIDVGDVKVLAVALKKLAHLVQPVRIGGH